MNALRSGIRGTGELFITLGVVVLLFCVYQLLWTNVSANAAASGVSDSLRSDWDTTPVQPDPGTAGTEPAPTPTPTKPPLGDGFAFIYIPRLGADWVRPVVQGVAPEDLKKGVGHYPETVLPGEIGNFAVAGHRATNGEPFRNLDQVKTGDVVVFETNESWFTYRITGSEIVLPTATDVILPVPRKPNVSPTQALLTMTTCNPRWASTQRLIVYGTLESTQPKSAGIPPALNGSTVAGLQ